jgi:hypothetical protein
VTWSTHFFVPSNCANNDKGAIREDADHVGAPPDLPVEPFLGIGAPDLTLDLFEGRNEKPTGPPLLALRWAPARGSLVLKGCNNSVEEEPGAVSDRAG